MILYGVTLNTNLIQRNLTISVHDSSSVLYFDNGYEYGILFLELLHIYISRIFHQARNKYHDPSNVFLNRIARNLNRALNNNAM